MEKSIANSELKESTQVYGHLMARKTFFLSVLLFLEATIITYRIITAQYNN